MRKNKIALFLALLMLCSFPVIAAQEIPNIELVENQILIADGETSTLAGSDYGGLISSFENTIHKILNFLSVKINEELVVEDLENFEVVVMPYLTANFTEISYVGEFTSSESVILPDRTETEHIFITNLVQVEIPGEDFFSGPYETAITHFGNITFFDFQAMGGAAYKINEGETIYTAPLIACDSMCPTASQIEEFSGLIELVDYDSKVYLIIPELNNMVVVLLNQGVGNYKKIILDNDLDNEWNFLTLVNGFSTNSFEKNTLLIATPWIYDLYVIV